MRFSHILLKNEQKVMRFLHVEWMLIAQAIITLICSTDYWFKYFRPTIRKLYTFFIVYLVPLFE